MQSPERRGRAHIPREVTILPVHRESYIYSFAFQGVPGFFIRFHVDTQTMARGALKGLKRNRPSSGEKVVVKGQLPQGAGGRSTGSSIAGPSSHGKRRNIIVDVLLLRPLHSRLLEDIAVCSEILVLPASRLSWLKRTSPYMFSWPARQGGLMDMGYESVAVFRTVYASASLCVTCP